MKIVWNKKQIFKIYSILKAFRNDKTSPEIEWKD